MATGPRRPRAAAWSAALVRRTTGGRAGPLVGARAVEQGTLGLATVLVARWMGVEAFAPVAALVVFNSLAIVASSLGVGHAILAGPLHSVARSQVVGVRAVGLILGGAAVAAGAIAGGTWWFAGILAAAIWVLSAEAFVRKASLLRSGGARRVAAIETVSSVVFFAVTLGVAARPDDGFAIVGLALVAKHAVEVVASTGWHEALGTTRSAEAGSIWRTQVLAYAIANVDFVIVAVVLSDAALSIYSVAFRVASAITSQLAYALNRLVVVDLAAAADTDARQRVHDRQVRALFGGGLVGVVVIVVAAPVLPVVLGDGWTGTAGLAIVLALAVPWRMTLGVSGSLMLSIGQAGQLVRWEAARLIATTAVLAAAAPAGLWTFSVVVTAVAVVSTVLLARASTHVAGLRPWLVPVRTALPAVAAAALVAAWASTWS